MNGSALILHFLFLAKWPSTPLRLFTAISNDTTLNEYVQSKSEYGEELTLSVYGFDNNKICKNRIREGETKIVFCNLDIQRQRVIISSSPMPITERNLDAVELLATG